MFPRIAWAIVAFLALVPVQKDRDEEQYTIGVDVDLVVFNVTVTDSRGRHVPGLTREDFRVFEEGRLQETTLFHAEDVPASIGLVIDNSGSMRDKRGDVVDAALAFAGASNPEDEMFVVTFNENVYLSLRDSIQLTGDLDRLRSALTRVAPAGLTALYDALAAGLEYLRTGTRDRKALVVLSDGGDNASRRSLADVLEIAQASNATIYTVGIYDQHNRDRNPEALRKIAEVAGGRAYFPGSVDDLEPAWREVAAAIRAQYTIGYYSTNPSRDGAFRKVNITASRDGQDLRIHTREGYLAAADASNPREP